MSGMELGRAATVKALHGIARSYRRVRLGRTSEVIERLRQSGGYSLVEVMASIVILSMAIIPMVGMFDMGLTAATTSGRYDEARALANEKLEQAKSIPYEASATTTDLKDNFPFAATTTQPTDGSTTAAIDNTTEAGVPEGLEYTVRKQHLMMDTSGTSTDLTATGATSAHGLIEVTVTVSWGDGKSYTTTGVVSRGTL